MAYSNLNERIQDVTVQIGDWYNQEPFVDPIDGMLASVVRLLKKSVENAQFIDPLLPVIMSLDFEAQKKIFEIKLPPTWNPAQMVYKETFDPNHEFFLKQGNFAFARLLYKLTVKSRSLDNRGDSDAFRAAMVLQTDLTQAFKTYLDSDKTEADTKIFTDIATQLIDAARPELEKHRGWKNLLANLALFVVTLGMAHAGFVIAGTIKGKAYTGQHGLFSLTKTDSQRHLDELDLGVKNMSPKIR